MQQSLSKKDYSQFTELMHALKGSAGSIGAMKLHTLCTEHHGKQRTDIEHITLLKEIIEALSQTTDACHAYIFDRNKATSSETAK